MQKSSQKKYISGNQYYENDVDSQILVKPLSTIAQASTIHDIATDLFDNERFKYSLIVSITSEINVESDRMNASQVVILQNEKKDGFWWLQHQYFNIKEATKSIRKFKIKNKDRYTIGINSDVPMFSVK